MSVNMTCEEKHTKPPDYTTVQKVIKTIFLVLAWVMLGLFTEIIGPTQKDLIIKTDSNYEMVSRSSSGRSVGYFIGGFIAGPLVDRLVNYCDLMIAICLDGGALATLIVPYATNVNLLWFLLMLSGICEGVITVAGNKITLEMWKDKSAGPLHVILFGFGLGSFIVPQIVQPFLAVLDSSTSNSTASTMYPWVSALNSTTMATETKPKYLKESRIEWAYLIVSITVAVLSLAFYQYQFCYHKSSEEVIHVKEKNNLKRVVKFVDPGTCTNGDRFFGVQLFFLLFFYFFNEAGGYILFGKFIRSYAIDKHKFASDDGSLINSIFWICFSVGRLFGLFTTRFIHIRLLILIEVFGAFTITLLLNIFARDNDKALWILTAALGFFLGPLAASGIAWVNFHVEITGFAITFMLMGGALGGLVYLWVIGYLYQYHGYDMFLYQLMTYGVFMVILTTLLTIVGKRHGGRFDNKDKEVEIVSQKEQNCVSVISTSELDLPPSYSNVMKSDQNFKQSNTTHESNRVHYCTKL